PAALRRPARPRPAPRTSRRRPAGSSGPAGARCRRWSGSAAQARSRAGPVGLLLAVHAPGRLRPGLQTALGNGLAAVDADAVGAVLDAGERLESLQALRLDGLDHRDRPVVLGEAGAGVGGLDLGGGGTAQRRQSGVELRQELPQPLTLLRGVHTFSLRSQASGRYV